MSARVVLAELEELDRFLTALCARQQYGDHVCMAAQPETVNGSPETLVDEGVEAGARIAGGWAEQVVAALEGKETEFEIRAAIQRAGAALDVDAFALEAEQTIMRGLMLGALDSVWERESGEEVAPATFAAVPGERQFVHAPFSEAVKLFEQRKVLPPAAFAALEQGAKRRAFTVAGLAKQELLDATHAELLRQLRDSRHQDTRGASIRDFQRFAKERLESAGWTPSNPSHVETVFRTNAVSAYSSGRVVEMTQPKVLALLPYWQILTVRDARQRPTHKAAHGIVLPANHPWWRHAYPPFGYNCRCRVCARTRAWLERNGVAVASSPPANLPDRGFESGTSQLISVPPSTLQEPTPNPVAAPPKLVPPAAKLPAPSPQLPLPYPVAPPLPPPRLPVPPSEIDFLAKKIAGPGGSNDGGIFEGSDGVRRYVKFYQDSAQAAGEHLANSLYRDLGLAGPKSELFVHEGKLAYASEMLPKTKTLGEKLNPVLAKQALKGFPADVLVANWDAAGLTLDNMLVTASGDIVRIDNGAAFLTRAQGARKPLETLGNVTEWETFFSHAKNPGYAQLAAEAGVSGPADLGPIIKRGVAKIQKVRDEAGGWRAYVEARSQGLSIADREQIIGMLETRTAFLERKVAELEAAAAKPVRKVVRNLDKLESGALPRPRLEPQPGMVHTEYKERLDARLKLLTEQERRTINHYTLDEYSKIRDAQFLTPEQWYDAWSKREPGKIGTDDYFRYRQYADHIGQAFTKLEAVAGPEAAIGEIYRGMNMKMEFVAELINAPAVEWQAVTSASWSSQTARGFAEGDQMGVVFVMKTRPEAAAMRMGIEPLSDLGEREILLRKGARFRVTDVQRDEIADKIVIYTEELLPGEAAVPGTIKLTAA